MERDSKRKAGSHEKKKNSDSLYVATLWSCTTQERRTPTTRPKLLQRKPQNDCSRNFPKTGIKHLQTARRTQKRVRRRKKHGGGHKTYSTTFVNSKFD